MLLLGVSGGRTKAAFVAPNSLCQLGNAYLTCVHGKSIRGFGFG